MSATIDERIVSMKFDNKGFDDGIKSTLGSLGKLKEGLNFKNIVSGFKNIDLSALKKSFDFRPIANGFKDFTKALDFSGISRGFGDFAKNFDISTAFKGFDNFRKNFNLKPIIDGFKTLGKSIDFKPIANGFKDFGKNFNWKGITNGFSEIKRAAQNVDMSGLGGSIDKVASRFDNLSVVGVTVLATLTTKAVDAGAKIAQSMFIKDPLAGLQEYETQMNAIQTIMANTSTKGTTMDDVNGALQDLNTYADKTIYNFAEMTRNIGTFTAAGVDLDTSTNAIKGIANVAAMSGSTSQQASTAMYQLSQAMASGTVKLMDWNSVVNAGMGGEVLQNALKETARNHGVAVDDLIEKNGSFRDSLQEGWLSTEILTETLSKFTGDLSESQLKQMGYTEEQIAGIIEMGNMANDAATKVKTFTQLLETLEEARGSGWAQSWQIIIGDFEEAKKLFTEVSNILGGNIERSAKARNEQLGIWKDMGGRTALIDALRNAFEAVMAVLKPIGDAWREVFPPQLGKTLATISFALRDFTEGLMISEKQASVLGSVFKFFFSIIKLGVTIIGGVLGVIFKVIGALFNLTGTVGEASNGLGGFFDFLQKAIENTDWITGFFEGLGDVIVGVIEFFGEFASVAVAAAGALGQFVSGGLTAALEYSSNLMGSFGGGLQDMVQWMKDFTLADAVSWLNNLGDSFAGLWDGVREFSNVGIVDWLKRLGDRFTNIWKIIEPLATAIGEVFAEIGNNIKEVFDGVDYDSTLDTIGVGLFGALLLMIRNFLKGPDKMMKSLTDTLTGGLDKIADGIVDTLGGLTGVLEAMQTSIKADAIMKIAIAIGILVGSIVVLSLIDSEALVRSLGAMAVMFIMLTKVMGTLESMLASPGIIKMPLLAGAMVLLAGAIAILTLSVVALSFVSWPDLIKGLAGVAAMLGMLAGASQIMAKNAGSMIAVGAALLIISIAVGILAISVGGLSGLDWPELIKGLSGVIVLLAALAGASQIMSKNAGSMIAVGTALVVVAIAIKLLVGAVEKMGKIDFWSLVKGLGAIVVVLGALAGFTRLINPVGMIGAATGMVLLSGALMVFAIAIERMGGIDLWTLIKGLSGVAITLGLITVAMNLMPPNMIVSAAGLLVVAAAITVLAQAMQNMGGMTWVEIAKSVVMLTASLGLIAAAMYVMTAALPGAAALLVVAAALSVLVPVLIVMGSLSWEVIGQGLLVLASVIGIFVAAAWLLSPITPILLLLGAAITLIGVGVLAAGTGLFLVASALAILATTATIAGPALIGLFESLLRLIPMAMEQFALGIARFAAVIGESVPAFIQAAITLVTALITGIATMIPEIVTVILDLVWQLLVAIDSRLPEFLDKGIDILMSILSGIASRIGEVVAEGINIVLQFIQGVDSKLKEVIRAAARMVVNFVDSVADEIVAAVPLIVADAKRIGWAIVDGITGGLASKADAAFTKVRNMGSQLVSSFMGAIGAASPSKLTYQGGVWFDEGIINGISSLAGAVNQSATDVGDGAVNALKDSMSNIAKEVPSTMDLNPRIKPVLDLSGVQRDAGQLGGLLGAPSLGIMRSINNASAISADRRSSKNASNGTSSTTVESRASEGVVFQQYNSSPRALSEIEIYRQTNNMLSAAKGALSR